MAGTGKARKKELAAAAAAFLAEVESPHASDRLRDYGLQRIVARAKAGEAGKAPTTARRAYHNPAMLRHVLIITLVVLLVMLVSTTGVYALSLDAQPDSPLYGTKIFFERARVTLTPSSSGDIHLEMGFSERRMQELQNMVASGNQDGAERWLREYSRNIEGAGVLFENLSDQEAEEISSQFQEMLDQQAQMMQGMRKGLPSGLSEPVENAYRMCDQERSRMQRRCGQQDTGEPIPGPGDQQGQENRPRSEDSSTSGGTSSPADTVPSNDNTGYEENGPSCETPLDTPVDSTPDTAPPTPSGTSQPEGNQAGAGDKMTGDAGYGGESTGKGHMP
jgi:hypothetical protein